MSHGISVLNFGSEIKISVDGSMGFVWFSYKMNGLVLVFIRNWLYEFRAELFNKLLYKVGLLFIFYKGSLFLFVDRIRVDFLE